MIKNGFFLLGLMLLALPMWLTMRHGSDIEVLNAVNREIRQRPAAAGVNPDFMILDGSRYRAENYSWLGIPVAFIDESVLLGPGDNSNRAPDEVRTKALLKKYKDKKRVVFRIDSWRVVADKNSDVSNQQHIDWYLQLIKWARQTLPGVDVGLFDLPYSPWFALKDAEQMAEYQKIAKKLEPLIAASDSLYPSFLVQFDDIEHLFYAMSTQLFLAKSHDKPVFPVMWHRVAAAELAGSEALPSELLVQQCEFLKKYANGVLWWSNPGEHWQEGWYEPIKEACFS